MAKKKTEIYLEEMREQMQHEFGLLKDRLDRINRNLDKWHENAIDLAKLMKRQEELLNKVSKTSDSVDDSLGNVYLAIRQNEYLQAWYPEQHNFPAMKVVGKHPAKEAR
jgi:predicted  nucleic acid-binding Zn-ribbon protein